MSEQIVNIYFPEKKDERRKGIFATRREDEIFGRRKQNTYITFYDLAQVNIGTAESQIWADHDIIKTPSYTCVEGGGGITYTYETFGNADYQAYTDKLMEIPVENWKYFYKEIEFELNPFYVFGVPGIHQLAAPCTYPPNMQMTDKNEDFYQPIFDAAVDRTGDPPFGGAAAVKAMIADIGYAWTQRGLEYKGLSHIEYYFNSGVREFFKADTDDAAYKVTASYDYSAAAVSDIAISGNIKVYLVPQIGLWAAVGSDPAGGGFYYKFNVLFAYQVAPRKNFPAYFDPYQQLDLQTLNDAFLDYQKNRTGMVVSQWESGTVPFDESNIDPDDWLVTEYSSHLGVNDHLYFPGSPASTTIVPTSGVNPFSMTDPFLVAVMKIGGVFYYVWKTTGASSESNLGTGYVAESEGY